MTLRTIAISLTATIASYGAWLAIREIRWIFWRDRCRRAEADRDYWKRIAAMHQQQAGDLAPDALRWRLHLKDCARGGKTAAMRAAEPVRAMTERLKAEFER